MADAALLFRLLAAVSVLTFAGAPGQAADPDPAQLLVRTVEPRAFGIRVGDVVERQVVVDIPSRLTLDEESLPRVGPQGPVLELRSLGRREARTSIGRQLTLQLRYQVFAAPVAVRSYELPKLQLKFNGEPRGDELRVDPWPLVVSALATEEASPREGLGELRPDIAPPLRDTTPERLVLGACAAAALLLAGYLALVYAGLPWWGRRQRPFTQALRAMQRLAADDGREACRALHAAFNQTAGRTLFADAIDGFVAQAPRFAALKDDIRIFFARSQAAFFADADSAPALQRDWLLAFARACRDAERGSRDAREPRGSDGSDGPA
jgi:mxaA protein